MDTRACPNCSIPLVSVTPFRSRCRRCARSFRHSGVFNVKGDSTTYTVETRQMRRKRVKMTPEESAKQEEMLKSWAEVDPAFDSLSTFSKQAFINPDWAHLFKFCNDIATDGSSRRDTWYMGPIKP